MITNQRQYRITQKAVRDFERSIERLDNDQTDTRPEMKPIYRNAFESQLEELRQELKAYDDLREGRVHEIEFNSLFDLPSTLIKARIASGMTQRELAGRLGLKEQQIQRYESRNYEGVSFGRLLEVAEGLKLRFEGRVMLPAIAAELKV